MLLQHRLPWAGFCDRVFVASRARKWTLEPANVVP